MLSTYLYRIVDICNKIKTYTCKSFSQIKKWLSSFKHLAIVAGVYVVALIAVTGFFAYKWYVSISVPDYIQDVNDIRTIQQKTSEYVSDSLDSIDTTSIEYLTVDNFKIGRHTINTNISTVDGGYFYALELDSGVYLIYYYRDYNGISLVSAMISIGQNLTALYDYVDEPVEGTKDVWLLDFSQGEITFDIS